MRIGWIGFHVEGLPALQALLERQAPVVAVITLAPDLAARRSGAGDYRHLCASFGVPCHEVRSINDDQSQALLQQLALDLAFVIGWTQLVRPSTMALVGEGMIGAHASLLPALRGRAPVNWALLRGLRETGNTLIWLAEGADQGDIIDQTVIPLTPYDTCASVYEHVATSNAEMIGRLLPRLLAGERPRRQQPPTVGPDLQARRPEDGVVEWASPARIVYDAVRALTRPYPGAFSWLGGRRYRIWQAALLPRGRPAPGGPGRVVGPVYSPLPNACGLAVTCSDGEIVVLELEDDDGRVLKGPVLSEQPWTGQRWSSCP